VLNVMCALPAAQGLLTRFRVYHVAVKKEAAVISGGLVVEIEIRSARGDALGIAGQHPIKETVVGMKLSPPHHH
jgi:hypothetical protein